MESEKIAKRALIVAVICLFSSFIISCITLSVLLVYTDSVAGLAHRIEKIEEKNNSINTNNLSISQ